MVVHYLLVPRCQKPPPLVPKKALNEHEEEAIGNQSGQRKKWWTCIEFIGFSIKVENNEKIRGAESQTYKNPMDFSFFFVRLRGGGQCYWPSLPTEETLEAGNNVGSQLAVFVFCFWWWNLDLKMCIFQDIGQSLKLALFLINYWCPSYWCTLC